MAKTRPSFATYPQDYFCGSQTRIYFGSIFVDDIATIQYNTSHSKTPLYGYGDHKFRTVAKGQFLVRGSFTIAFKESGYLYSIIRLMRADQQKKLGQNNINKYMDYIGQGYTPEQMLDMTSTNKATKNVFGFAKPDDDFEDVAEVLEDTIWGKKGEPTSPINRIPRADELDYNRYTGSSIDSDIDIEGFDILMTFGDYRSGNDSVEHTMISINNVHITGESMIVSPSAEPIGLTCEFFARGINEKVSSAWPIADTTAANNSNDDGDKSTKAPLDSSKKAEPVTETKTVSNVTKPTQPIQYMAQADQTKFNNDVAAVYNDFIRIKKIIEPKMSAVDSSVTDMAARFASALNGFTDSTDRYRVSNYNGFVKLYNLMLNTNTWNPDTLKWVGIMMYPKDINVSLETVAKQSASRKNIF